jgi:small subunit ribosomal protein S1
MNENFAELFEKSISELDLAPGSLVKAKIVSIEPEYVVVNAGLKTEAYIPIEEFKSRDGSIGIEIGDTIDVVVESVEDGGGHTHLSREKAKRKEMWKALEVAQADSKNVKGVITERVKGGFTVEIEKVRAFLPASLIDVKPVRDISYLEGKELDFKVVKIDKKRNNIVVSRRAVLTEEFGGDANLAVGSLQEGQEVIGIVKNLTDYGAFIDLGGVDGLLHITDMSWRRIKHPAEVLTVGQELKVKIIKFDRDKNRVSLGLKQLSEDPWVDLSRRHPVNSRLFGNVTNITDYGCFVEIEPGIEGLVHMSEMDWTNKNINPGKLVNVGDEVEVMILEIDEERRRISLGMKQCQSNPWDSFAATHSKGEKISGKIKSITDFGIFVGLEGNIDGLVHLSDIAWVDSEKVIRNFKKGQEVEAVILGIDSARERISLGMKQLEDDVIATYYAANPKDTVVNCIVKEITPKAVAVELEGGIEGRIKISDISSVTVQDPSEFFDVGDEIKATIIGFDKKARVISLSTKEFQSGSAEQAPTAKLGDLFKEHEQE